MTAARLAVTFHKVQAPRPLAWWEAVRPTGGRTRGGWMPIGRGRIPHDLAHLACEGHLGIDHGFWGLLARGATYRRGTDRTPTQPGRQLVRRHRSELDRAERIGNEHHFAWLAGGATPVAATFERFERRWSALSDGGTLTVAWPSLVIDGAAAAAARRDRRAPTGRGPAPSRSASMPNHPCGGCHQWVHGAAGG